MPIGTRRVARPRVAWGTARSPTAAPSTPTGSARCAAGRGRGASAGGGGGPCRPRHARAACGPGARWRTTVSMIGTPRTKNGMNSGAKKKNVWPLNWLVGLPADEHRRRRHQQPEHQRAAVAHEDAWPGGSCRAGTRGTRRARCTAMSGPVLSGRCSSAGVGQPRRVEEERAGGDGDDAGGQPVEPVDEVDRVGHADHPEHADQERQVGRQRRTAPTNGMRKYSMLTPRDHEHAGGQHHARRSWPAPTPRGGRRPCRPRT